MTHLYLESSVVTENTSELTEKLVRCGVVGVKLGVDGRHGMRLIETRQGIVALRIVERNGG